MMYTTFSVGEQELKLRITTRACVDLEKKLGKNPLQIFVGVDEGRIPTVTELAATIHAALQPLEHGYTEAKVYDLIDKYVEDGHTISELYPVLIEAFKVSGFIKSEEEENEEESDEKNA